MFEAVDLFFAHAQEEEPLARRLDFGGVTGMDRRRLFELLTARRPDVDELPGAFTPLVVRFQHRPHGEILRLGVGELGAEEGGQWHCLA